ncbi:MAG: alkaline phosphatase PhoX [Spirulinaceae cyanobacterium]
MTLSRRRFFAIAGATTATCVVASPLKALYARTKSGDSVVTEGFGLLQKDPQKILNLPPGFQYRILSKTGEQMSDGHTVPEDPDGMAAFPGQNGTTILVRNHEVSPGQLKGVRASATQKYDPWGQGGTTTLVLNSDRQVIKQFASLAGTSRNCAGGTTPWGSWISCEEDISTPATTKNKPAKVALKHGYNFEVPATQQQLVAPTPLIAMGRFNHEAIAVDPATSYVYQTEDRDDSCFYRFRPQEKGNLQAGGVLEALVIEGMPKIDTSTNFPVDVAKAVAWVKIADVDPQQDTLRYEAQSKGAAIFKRGEGICYSDGAIYFTCTSGGNAGRGQVFRYTPQTEQIELFVESPGGEVLDYPDNLVMSPFGDLIVCEDGYREQFLVGITPQGQCYKFASNAVNFSEFAGVCFAPDGKTMFVNIQKPGITLAVWGAWS